MKDTEVIALERWSPEGQEFKIIFCDFVSSRLRWARLALVVSPILLGKKK